MESTHHHRVIHNKTWVKNLWSACKREPPQESLWRQVSEMVGYFSGEEGRKEPLPVGADCTLSPLLPVAAASVPAAPAVRDRSGEEAKSVVCSPDIPAVVPEEAPPDSSTAELFTCTYCSKSFGQKNAFQNHMKIHNKEGEDPYQCNYCGKTFAVPARLTRHYRTHTGEKPYECEVCKKSFSVKENLSVHRRIHTKERPYKCDVCARAFEHSGKLHRHMRIHTGERPHKCSVCNKTFIQSGQLVIHMRTHTGEKPYVCKDCGKGFTCSKQLKVHNRTHTGERPYSCEICGKSFGYNHVLKLHQVAHYGEKVYKCTICNETFTSKKTMEMHIKSHSDGSGREEGSSGDVETSCASSASDKENKESPKPPEYSNIRELCGYLYRGEKPGGLDPALLAAVAVATSENNREEYQPSPEHVLEEPAGLESVYIIPEITPPSGNSSPTGSSPPPDLSPREVSPPPREGSSSPEDSRELSTLPPRKRSKAILKSMEKEAPPVRYSSVIHYAKAS